jgi:hypothetical protein
MHLLHSLIESESNDLRIYHFTLSGMHEAT